MPSSAESFLAAQSEGVKLGGVAGFGGVGSGVKPINGPGPQPEEQTVAPPSSKSTGGRSPFRVQTKWLSSWLGTVIDVGAGTVSVTIAGDDTVFPVKLEIATPAVGKTVRVNFGTGGKCAVVGVLGG